MYNTTATMIYFPTGNHLRFMDITKNMYSSVVKIHKLRMTMQNITQGEATKIKTKQAQVQKSEK